MRTLYGSCPCCESFNFEILCDGFGSQAVVPFDRIVICQDCGTVSRNPDIDTETTPKQVLNVYGDENFNLPRLKVMTEFLKAEKAVPGPGDYHLDIGSGPGWFADLFYQGRDTSRLICVEPSLEAAAHARGRLPNATVLPCRIEETSFPAGMFKLITVSYVDFLTDFRKLMTKIDELLAPDGVAYFETGIFLPQEAWTGVPILDAEDVLGVKPFARYFGKEQYEQALSQFFDVTKVFEHTLSSFEYRGRERKSLSRGVLCRKKSAPAPAKYAGKNFYADNMQFLQNFVIENSVEDLRAFFSNGVKTVAICGTGVEADELAKTIEKYELGKVTGFFSVAADKRDAVPAAKVTPLGKTKSVPADVLLVATLEHEYEYEVALANLNWQNRAFSVFRPGLKTFAATSSKGNRIQLKAFLPLTVAEADKREQRIRLAVAAH